MRHVALEGRCFVLAVGQYLELTLTFENAGELTIQVTVANPEDEVIYFYKEGMAAPMGHFRNDGKQPRAVLVVDRSLREVRPGVYETLARMSRAGNYDLALFVASPRVEEIIPAADQYAEEADSFAGAVLGETELPYGVEDAMANMQILDAIFRSEQSGRWESTGL